MYTSIPAVILKHLTLVAAGAVASCVSGLSVVMSKSTDAEKKKTLWPLGRLASSHLPLGRMHGRMDNDMCVCVCVSKYVCLNMNYAFA